MKIAVCSTGDTIDSPTSPRFGRCAHFVIVDTETFEANALENPGVLSEQGAGVLAAQIVASTGVLAVVTGNLGPNAHQVFSAAGIKVYACAGDTVRHAVNMFNAGTLHEVSAPTVDAHFGINATSELGSGRSMGMGRGLGMGRRGASGGGRGRSRT